MEKEIKKRSALKSLIWRIVGIVLLALITYLYTGSMITMGLITLIHHSVFLVVYYLHERMWLKIKLDNVFWRSVAKMFTYETLCGNIILGTITFCITGSWKDMTSITLTYIGIKHVIYIWNEFIWRKIKWGKK